MGQTTAQEARAATPDKADDIEEAAAKAVRATKDAKRRKIDLSKGARGAASRTATYWIGIVPGLRPPCDPMGIGGIQFPRHESPHDPDAGGDARVKVMGSLVVLDDARVRNLADAMESTIVRWRERKGKHAHGALVRLLTEADIEAALAVVPKDQKEAVRRRLEQKTVVQSFREGEDDMAANYVYCMKTDRRGSEAPKSVAEAGGIELP